MIITNNRKLHIDTITDREIKQEVNQCEIYTKVQTKCDFQFQFALMIKLCNKITRVSQNIETFE